MKTKAINLLKLIITLTVVLTTVFVVTSNNTAYAKSTSKSSISKVSKTKLPKSVLEKTTAFSSKTSKTSKTTKGTHIAGSPTIPGQALAIQNIWDLPASSAMGGLVNSDGTSTRTGNMDWLVAGVENPNLSDHYTGQQGMWSRIRVYGAYAKVGMMTKYADLDFTKAFNASVYFDLGAVGDKTGSQGFTVMMENSSNRLADALTDANGTSSTEKGNNLQNFGLYGAYNAGTAASPVLGPENTLAIEIDNVLNNSGSGADNFDGGQSGVSTAPHTAYIMPSIKSSYNSDNSIVHGSPAAADLQQNQWYTLKFWNVPANTTNILDAGVFYQIVGSSGAITGAGHIPVQKIADALGLNMTNLTTGISGNTYSKWGFTIGNRANSYVDTSKAQPRLAIAKLPAALHMKVGNDVYQPSTTKITVPNKDTTSPVGKVTDDVTFTTKVLADVGDPGSNSLKLSAYVSSSDGSDENRFNLAGIKNIKYETNGGGTLSTGTIPTSDAKVVTDSSGRKVVQITLPSTIKLASSQYVQVWFDLPENPTSWTGTKLFTYHSRLTGKQDVTDSTYDSGYMTTYGINGNVDDSTKQSDFWLNSTAITAPAINAANLKTLGRTHGSGSAFAAQTSFTDYVDDFSFQFDYWTSTGTAAATAAVKINGVSVPFNTTLNATTTHQTATNNSNAIQIDIKDAKKYFHVGSDNKLEVTVTSGTTSIPLTVNFTVNGYLGFTSASTKNYYWVYDLTKNTGKTRILDRLANMTIGIRDTLTGSTTAKVYFKETDTLKKDGSVLPNYQYFWKNNSDDDTSSAQALMPGVSTEINYDFATNSDTANVFDKSVGLEVGVAGKKVDLGEYKGTVTWSLVNGI